MQKRIDAIEDHDAASIEAERRERIEQWGIEHSRVLLDKIEKEIRRRRASTISQRARSRPSTARAEQTIKGSLVEKARDEATAEVLSASLPTVEDSELF